jgi:hypothetical protein
MACIEVFCSCVERSRWTSPCSYIAGRTYVGNRTVENRGVPESSSSVNIGASLLYTLTHAGSGMVIVVNFVVYAETVAATPIVVAKLGKYTVVVAAPAPAFGKYAEQKEVKSKAALTVTLRKLGFSSINSQ